MADLHASEQPTLISPAIGSTHERVRNLLGLPGSDADWQGWSHEQKRDFALYLISQDLHSLSTNGCALHAATCHRVAKLEKFYIWLAGGVAFLVAGGAVVTWILHLAGLVRVSLHP